MKVLTITGTRPEIIRTSLICPKLDCCCDHTIVHTNRRYYDAVHCAIPYLSSEDNLSNKEVLYELLQKGQLLKKHEVYT